MTEEKRHGLDEGNKWMTEHGFKFQEWIRDSRGYRFAMVHTFDRRNYITCCYRGFGMGYVGLDCEILDREPFIVDKMKAIAKEHNLPRYDYVYLILELNSKNLYDVDSRIYDLKSRKYPIEYGNEISRNSPSMEKRRTYKVPVRDAEFVNFFNNKTMNEGEKFWKEMFHNYIKNAIKWVGNEFPMRYLKDTYGWGVDFIVLGQTNKCIEVGYHEPTEKEKRMEEARKHNANAYFINHHLKHYQGNKENVGKEIQKLATSLDLQLTDRYYEDFSMARSIGMYEEDE